MTESQITGVIIKQLISHGDSRGFFREIIRETDDFFSSGGHFGQWSHSKMQYNVVKAWHYHHVQTDWWYVTSGAVETVLIDNREESPTYRKKMIFLMGDEGEAKPLCVKIPPGVLHGCKVLSPEAHLFYITSHTYNPSEEGRIPYNNPDPGHNWGEGVIVVDNDKRFFTPSSTREKILP